ncbi:hypothetical protein [Brachybacterium timonense]|uniref:hypothetical protein n=1 Tax=Brachybacterium timonense TaxID=2050896 RepID=UPI000D0AC95C|nr:hypothetical protein [Brachybacterium timonense]
MSTLIGYVPVVVGLVLTASLAWDGYRLIARDMHPLRVLTTVFSAAVTLGILGLIPLLPPSLALILAALMLGLAGATVYAVLRLLDEKRPRRVAAVQAEGSKLQVAALRRPSITTVVTGALVLIALLVVALYAAL